MKFLLLLRPLNLLIIVLTMYVTKVYIIEALLTGSFLIELGDVYIIPDHFNFNFLLLVLMMVFLAAGGNIINDYFDVRADRINKPTKTYIDYHVKRKWAIISHLLFTGLAIIISIYLWAISGQFLFIVLAVGIAAILWFYSLYLKRIFFIGNLIIAILTALVPFVVYLYMRPVFMQFEFTSLDFTMGQITVKLTPYHDILPILSGYAGIAFLTNLIREMIKDISDILGDKRVGCRTVPIILGVITTKVFISLLLLLCLSIFTAPFMLWPKTVFIPQILFPILVIIFLLILTFILLILANNKSKYKYSSFTLKLMMLVGILLPIILNSGINE